LCVIGEVFHGISVERECACRTSRNALLVVDVVLFIHACLAGGLIMVDIIDAPLAINGAQAAGRLLLLDKSRGTFGKT
jgi:hypothetical protein